MDEEFGSVAKRWNCDLHLWGSTEELASAIDAAVIDLLNEKLGFLKWGLEDLRGRVRICDVGNQLKECHYFLDGNLVLKAWTWWEGKEMAWKVVRV